MNKEEIEEIRARNWAIQRYIASYIERELVRKHEATPEVAKEYADAWLDNVVTRGRSTGLVVKTKPRGGAPKQGIMWEAWRHWRGQASAHSLGVGPAYMSIHGVMYSIMGQPNGVAAFEAAIDGIMSAQRAMKKGEL